MKYLLVAAMVMFTSVALADEQQVKMNVDISDIIADTTDLVSWSDNTITTETMKTCQWEFDPKEDITPYELALVIKESFNDFVNWVEPPENLKRHFKEVCW